MKKNSSYYSRIKKRFSITFILIALLPLLMISWSSSQFYQNSYLTDTTNGLKRIAVDRTEVINLFINDQKILLLQLIQLYSYNDFSNQDELDRIFSAVSKGGIVDLGVIDAAGKHVTYVGPYRQKLIDKNYADAEWFQEVMVNGSHISDIFLGFRGVPHLVVAVSDPLKKWVLRATINSELLNGFLQSAKIGEKGDAFIVNRTGKLQTPDRFNTDSLTEDEKKLLGYHTGSEVTEINNFIYVTNWLKDGDWLLLIKLETKSVFEVFYHARNMDLFTLLGASLMIIAASIVIIRHMVNKIEVADRERAGIDSQMLQVEKMASLGRMAAGVAHEVNNPLQLITDQSGWIGELLDEEDPEKLMHLSEYRKSIAKIKLHVSRASCVTHRLLGFSRKIEAEKESVNINLLIEEVISFIENSAMNSDITINKYLQNDIPTIMTDGAQIQQVILNILNNSMDAISKHGTIDITSKVDGQNILVDFGDTGPGINPEIMDNIFDPFFTTKEPGKGTGLGLSISYNITQSLGGLIEVRNKKNGGAIFTLKLPIIKLCNLGLKK
ncbi:MAG: hypothetical protein KKD63_14585 [Proteobacteria bacterium]|nr:hypothetical protein [Desulfobulbaceae bacterium]MBU4154096.1 hypothetical protein [Pseudomonadota bacterium]